MGVSQIKSNPSGAVQWEFELGENLNAGEPIYIYDDAGAKVKKVYSCIDDIDSEFRGYYQDSCMLDSTHVMVVFRDLDNSNRMYVICGDIQGDNSINWGAKVLVYAAYAYYLSIDKLDTDRFVVIGRGTGSKGSAWAGDVSGTTVSIGSEHPFSVGYGYDQTVCYLDTDLFVVGFRDSGMLNHGYCRIGSVNPATNVITWGTAAEHGATSTYENWVCKPDPASAKFAVFYRRNNGATVGLARASTYSGTPATTIDGFGLEVQFCNYPYYVHAESISTDKVAVCYRDTSDMNKGKMIVGTFGGTTPAFTLTDAVVFSPDMIYYPTLCKSETDAFHVAWLKYVTPYEGLIAKCTVSGTTITKQLDQCFQNDRVYYSSLSYISDGKYFLIWFAITESQSNYVVVEGDVCLLGYTSGLMQESGLLGETKPIDLLGGISEQLTGMTPGDHQYIKCDASISDVITQYHIGIALAADKMLIIKTE